MPFQKVNVYRNREQVPIKLFRLDHLLCDQETLQLHLAEQWRDKLVAFARSATVLVHDTTYTTEEYASHRGWGHSTYRDGVELALEAGVETLVLFHHEPRRTDDQLDAEVDACRAMVQERGGTLQVMAAAEGLTLTV